MAALTALAIASTTLGVAGNLKEGQAARRQGMAENSLYQQNAAFADVQAADALSRGNVEESQARGDTRRLMGSQRAALAAQGIDIGDGSAGDILDESNALGELDALTIRNNARREAWGYQVQAWDLRTQGRNARDAGKAARSGARLQAGVTLLGGAADIYGAYKADAARRGTVVPRRGGSGAGGVSGGIRGGKAAP